MSVDALLAEIHGARFEVIRFRAAYDIDDVDTFLERLVTAITQGEDVGPMVDQVQFEATRVREGYEPHQVDEFLFHVVAAQASRGLITRGQADRDTAEAATPQTEPLPTVIEEPQGLLTRLLDRVQRSRS